MSGKLLVLFSLLYVAYAANTYVYDCPDSDQHFYPHPKSCEKFIECNNGEAVEVVCFGGFYFNPETKFCDFPENVVCVIEESEEIEETEEIEESEENTGGPVGTCRADNNGFAQFLADSADCTIYYVCDWGRAIQMPCPAKLHFNPILNVCDYPVAAGCTAGQ